MSNLRHEFVKTTEGVPCGGVTTADGLSIRWEEFGNGGCRPETVLDALIERLEFYQKSSMADDHNDEALASLRIAKTWLSRRKQTRSFQGLQSNQPSENTNRPKGDH